MGAKDFNPSFGVVHVDPGNDIACHAFWSNTVTSRSVDMRQVEWPFCIYFNNSYEESLIFDG